MIFLQKIEKNNLQLDFSKEFLILGCSWILGLLYVISICWEN